VSSLPQAQTAHVLEVPAVSGNSLRHQLVRAPAMLHLFSALGLFPDVPGKGPLPSGVEALFENGGNIEAGAKQPSNTFSLAWRARELYPTLDLLGGVTDSFDLGESRLSVAGWLICAENRGALLAMESPAAYLPEASISAFEMLEDVTHTRQASSHGEGQMIYTFETLIKGARILARLTLAPYTPVLTRGALLVAVTTFMQQDNTIGGQAARGYGNVQAAWLAGAEHAGYIPTMELYEAYLRDHADVLVAGLRDGTLGTGTHILS
jgi:hypothetical protein